MRHRSARASAHPLHRARGRDRTRARRRGVVDLDLVVDVRERQVHGLWVALVDEGKPASGKPRPVAVRDIEQGSVGTLERVCRDHEVSRTRRACIDARREIADVHLAVAGSGELVEVSLARSGPEDRLRDGGRKGLQARCRKSGRRAGSGRRIARRALSRDKPDGEDRHDDGKRDHGTDRSASRPQVLLERIRRARFARGGRLLFSHSIPPADARVRRRSTVARPILHYSEHVSEGTAKSGVSPHLRNVRFRAGALIALAVVLGLILWLALRDTGGSSSTASAGKPTAVTEDQLSTLAASVGHPVFWLGRRDGYTYE